jgi:hypothetical protein
MWQQVDNKMSFRDFVASVIKVLNADARPYLEKWVRMQKLNQGDCERGQS